MDPHESIPVAVFLVDAVDRVDDGLHRRARELVAEDVEAYLLVRGGEGADGARDPLHGARIAERGPSAQPIEDDPAPARGVGIHLPE